MTRSEAYAEGWQDGCLWAEDDIRARNRSEPEKDSGYITETGRAEHAGLRRGYRDTWARWDAGTLTWEMLEHAPVNR